MDSWANHSVCPARRPVSITYTGDELWKTIFLKRDRQPYYRVWETERNFVNIDESTGDGLAHRCAPSHMLYTYTCVAAAHTATHVVDKIIIFYDRVYQRHSLQTLPLSWIQARGCRRVICRDRTRTGKVKNPLRHPTASRYRKWSMQSSKRFGDIAAHIQNVFSYLECMTRHKRIYFARARVRLSYLSRKLIFIMQTLHVVKVP